ncbi:MAG: acylneuraminate cytidylyltransferase family protein [Nitrospinota bacterium]
MFLNKKVLCIIPARSGSKAIPQKNIKILCGKPLIAYSIEQALKIDSIDRTIVSTDDKEIAKISNRFGAETPFIRPSHLAQDDSSTLDVLLHTMEWCQSNENKTYDIILLLHANAPLRNLNDIQKCLEILVKKSADNVFSVTPASNNPYFNMVEQTDNGGVSLVKKGNFSNRQSAPPVYDMNSSIYTWWAETLMEKKAIFMPKTKIHVMPRERSIDIDEPLDFRIAEMIMKENKV